jgi:hypothetical protein
MASFLHAVVHGPSVEIATHDWSSIKYMHFYKVGRIDDGWRTCRRMVFLLSKQNNQMYLSLINGHLSAGNYSIVLILWTEVSTKGADFTHELIVAFLYALVNMAMQVIEKTQ